MKEVIRFIITCLVTLLMMVIIFIPPVFAVVVTLLVAAGGIFLTWILFLGPLLSMVYSLLYNKTPDWDPWY